MDVVGRLDFEGRYLNVYNDVEEPLFLAVDVARMIDYSVGNTAHMLEDLADGIEKVLVNVPTRTLNTNSVEDLDGDN